MNTMRAMTRPAVLLSLLLLLAALGCQRTGLPAGGPFEDGSGVITGYLSPEWYWLELDELATPHFGQEAFIDQVTASLMHVPAGAEKADAVLYVHIQPRLGGGGRSLSREQRADLLHDQIDNRIVPRHASAYTKLIPEEPHLFEEQPLIYRDGEFVRLREMGTRRWWSTMRFNRFDAAMRVEALVDGRGFFYCWGEDFRSEGRYRIIQIWFQDPRREFTIYAVMPEDQYETAAPMIFETLDSFDFAKPQF